MKLPKYKLVVGLSMALLIAMYSFRSTESIGFLDDVSGTVPLMRGLCWVAGDSIADHNIDQVLDIGVNWISQTPFGWMNGHDSPIVVLSNERAWWGETDRGIRHTAEHAKAAAIKTMLKPHIWLRRSGDKWRSDIAMNSEAEWDDWFESYESWILHYARLAEECKIESLCIGTELHQTIKREDRWRHMIAEIRKVYSGQLTYAANWYKEYQDVEFWDELDYIGIQGYFPLSKKQNPSKKELLKSWKKHKTEMARLSRKYNKKIVFTEIGYKNTADAAKEPWTWPQDMDHSVQVSDETQKICYEALFESLWHESWFDGIFIWKWFHSTHQHKDFDEYFAHWDRRRQARAESRGREMGPAVYFTPQRTETIHTLKEWYSPQSSQ